MQFITQKNACTLWLAGRDTYVMRAPDRVVRTCGRDVRAMWALFSGAEPGGSDWRLN